MPTAKNKDVIGRLNEEFWNKGNVQVLDEVFAPHFVDHTPQPGVAPDREGFKAFALSARAALADIQSQVEDVIADGDRVVWRWSVRGTQTGTFAGVPPTGKQITMTGITIDRLDGAKIVERWSQIDSLGLLEQLGVIPSPEQASG